jgi:integration host factor subunit alpha
MAHCCLEGLPSEAWQQSSLAAIEPGSNRAWQQSSRKRGKGSMSGQNLGRSTMTKADIVEKVYQKIGFSKKEASELVELVFTSLKDVLIRGDKVKISGFGNFVVREKNERVGRNPQTGEQIKISARRVLTFRPSQVLKAMLNGEDITGLKDDD